MEIDIPSIIQAVGTLLLGWFTYNQYTKNKKTDLKIEQLKKEELHKDKVRNDTISTIYGELWKLLHELNADRVYIAQPHPLSANMFVSITYEITRNGVTKIGSYVKSKPISDVAVFAAELSQRDFLYYKNIDCDVKDKRAKAILNIAGDTSAIIKKLSDSDYDWVGNIFCEYLSEVDVAPDYAKKLMTEAANSIQYILPEIK